MKRLWRQVNILLSIFQSCLAFDLFYNIKVGHAVCFLTVPPFLCAIRSPGLACGRWVWRAIVISQHLAELVVISYGFGSLEEGRRFFTLFIRNVCSAVIIEPLDSWGLSYLQTMPSAAAWLAGYSAFASLVLVLIVLVPPRIITYVVSARFFKIAACTGVRWISP